MEYIMAQQVHMETCTRNYELNPWQLFVVTWRLIISETAWNFVRFFRIWEIRQLQKRLDQEKIRLANAVLERPTGQDGRLSLKDPDLDLILGQVSFLEEEAEHLRKELQAKRRTFLEKRRAKYLGE